MTAPPDDPTGRGPRRRRLIARLTRPRPPRSRLRRRISSAARMVAALALVGGVYAAFTPSVSAQDTPVLSGAAQAGKGLFDQSCISCHGQNAEGVPGRGPSLIGVGSASVEFQVTTGRMPAAQQGAQIDRKPPQFSDDQARQIGAY